MFYCIYCDTERDDSLINTIYKNSIKCDICVRNGTKLTDTRVYCICGASHVKNQTTHLAHIKSKNHLKFLKGLSS